MIINPCKYCKTKYKKPRMKKYRTLNDGELVMAGDEFWSIDRRWVPASGIGEKTNSYNYKMYRRPLTETSSQMTDTCPDCSEHPCDCGLPAGYKADIRFAANFAPHIKVVEVSNVAEIIEHRDRLAGGLKWIAGWNHQLFDENTAMQMRDKAEQALQSLNPDHTVDVNDMIAARKEGQMSEQWHYEQKGESYIKVDTLHKIRTLETELSAVTEQLKEAQEEIVKLTKGWADCVLKRSKAEDQRDRLAEALREVATYDPSDGQCNSGYSCKYIAEQALRSLNPDHTVAANDMTAAVKGGADEIPR